MFNRMAYLIIVAIFWNIGCSPVEEVQPQDIYKYSWGGHIYQDELIELDENRLSRFFDYNGNIAKNISIECVKTVKTYDINNKLIDQAVLKISNLDDDAVIPVLNIKVGGRYIRFFKLESRGAQNIKIIINDNIGYTPFAGLFFKQEGVINIWEDGTVEIDRQGVEAKDKFSYTWISKKSLINGKIAIIMVKKK